MSETAQVENGSDKTELQSATQLPEPQGYHILCAIPDIEDKYDSGLYKTDQAQKTKKFLPQCFLWCL